MTRITAKRCDLVLSSGGRNHDFVDGTRAAAENAKVRLLERESQLAALREYAADAARGVGRLVLVEGEAGIGKSTLLERLEEVVPDATWAWGACEGLSTPRPLAPLHDLADQLGGELQKLCRDQASRDHLFDALVDRLREEPDRLVIVFEDVHWADDATLDLLRLLARRVQRLPVLVLVTFREEHPAPRLREALGELVRQRTVRRVTLPTLSLAAVQQLAGDREVDAAEVHRLTGGNPYFVAELLATGREGLARTAHDAVLSRVGTLSRDARTAIEAAALLGNRIDADLVAEVSDVGRTSFDELVEAGLVLVSGRSLRFRHEIARLAIADALPPFRAAGIHARALDALARRGSTDASRLAFHAEGAGDGAAVVRHAAAAAAEAAALSSHREAAEHYRRALRFGEDGDGTLRRALAEELGLLDAWEEAEWLWREAIAATPDEDVLARGEAVRMHSRALWRLSRGAEARAEARAAVAILEPLGPTHELARAVVEVAGFAMMHSENDVAHASARQALALAQELGATDVMADALNVLGCLELDAGNDWERLLHRSLEVALEGGARIQAGRSYVNLYSAYVDLDRVAEGERTFHEGTKFIEEHEVPVYGFCMMASRTEALELTGRWDEALEVTAGFDDSPMSPINRMHMDLGRTRVAVRRGAPEAGVAVQALVDLALGTAEPQWIAPTLTLRAEWHWLAGRQEEAQHDLRDAAEAAAHTRYVGRHALWLHRLGLPSPSPDTLDDPYATQLRGDFAAAAEQWEARQMPYDAAWARLDSGEPEAMVAALATFERLGAEPVAALARRRLREAGLRPGAARRATREHPAGLTEREQDVLALLCRGCSNADIARELVISVKTAGHHVSALLAKLGVASRQEAAAEALRRGLAPEDREPARAT